jgi:hypothetical protein
MSAIAPLMGVDRTSIRPVEIDRPKSRMQRARDLILAEAVCCHGDGSNSEDAWRQVGVYVGRILKGVK